VRKQIIQAPFLFAAGSDQQRDHLPSRDRCVGSYCLAHHV
jgi:hypothetical protein